MVVAPREGPRGLGKAGAEHCNKNKPPCRGAERPEELQSGEGMRAVRARKEVEEEATEEEEEVEKEEVVEEERERRKKAAAAWSFAAAGRKIRGITKEANKSLCVSLFFLHRRRLRSPSPTVGREAMNKKARTGLAGQNRKAARARERRKKRNGERRSERTKENE